MTTTADDRLKAALRELALRQRVYPGLVAREKMSQTQADYEITVMADIVEVLRGHCPSSQLGLFAEKGL